MERPAFRAVSQGLFPGFLSLVLMTPVSGLPPLPLCLPPLFALPGLRNLRACPSLCRLRGGSGARTLVRGGLPRPSWPRGPPLRPRDLVSGHLPAEGAGPAGRSLKSGILVGVGAALLRGSGSRILVSDILRFWNPESGNRDLESGTGIWNLETGIRNMETGIWKPVTDFRSMESERAGLGASARGKA